MSTTSLEGIVKAVLGGNTIKICHPQFYDREKTLILADVKSPRFAPKDGEDEKWAFEAREFLRKKLIGKSIRFRVDYTVKETGMNYATIYLEDENINESVVDAGWGKVKTDIKNPSDDLKRLIDLQKTAQEQHLGMWSNKENYAKSAKNEDPQALLKSFKGKTVDVIVEYVISGTALKVRLPTNEVVVMNLTGVYCPSVTKDNATKQKVALPFSKEAKTHTEVRLLNRDVTVLFEGIDNGSSKKDTKPKDNKDNKETKEKTSNLHGSIIISADETSEKPVTYQEELLMIGYVSVDERSAPKSKYAQRLRAAEQKAKSERKNLWIDYVPPKVSLQQADNDFSARVLDVLSGDTLKIVKNDGKEEKISLSNIRTKKFISYTKKPEKKEKDAKESTEKKVESEPWAWEARELLRSKVAGKEINVEVDYRKEFGSAEKKEERRFCTVLVNKKSIAVELVREGFAEVIKIKADEERSSAFDQLILAENEAIKRQKGIHGKKKAPNHLYSNVTGDAAAKLNKLLTGKSGNTKAVVEKVLSASKFILSLPNDNSVITFSLTGIAIPSSDRNKELAEEARQLTLITASCRDVELVLEPNVDKAGSFVGQLLIGGKNYANTLLEAGLAIVQPYAKRLKIFEELNESEAKGKKAKKGVWKLEDHTTAFPERKKREQPEQQEKPVAQKFTVSHSRKTQTIRVTDFEDPVTFFYQGSDVVEKLKTVENLIAQLDIKTLATLSSPVVGSICLSQFTDDECWYRAKIISINGAKAVVLYSDFGNSEEKELSTLKEIPAGNQLLTIPDCAQKARLAFVKPHSQEFRFELESLLRDTLLDGEWQLTVEYSNNGVNYVTLVQNNGKSEDSLNKQIIRSGLVFADKEVLFGEFRSIAKSFIEEQEFAISRRLNLWELGEIYESDEEEI